MFGPGGKVIQPANALRKHAFLVERGSFRPISNVNPGIIRQLESCNTECLRIFSRELLEQISSGDPE